LRDAAEEGKRGDVATQNASAVLGRWYDQICSGAAWLRWHRVYICKCAGLAALKLDAFDDRHSRGNGR
jgi:hypothetical protein